MHHKCKTIYIVDSPHALGLNSNVCIGGAAGVPSAAAGGGGAGGNAADGKNLNIEFTYSSMKFTGGSHQRQLQPI